MGLIRRIKEQGIPLRMAHIVMTVITVLLTAVLLFETYQASVIFVQLSAATDEYITMQKSANELMDASDYLTEEVQCFTVTGAREHLDHYFNEAEITRRRETALKQVQEAAGDSDAFRELQSAMDESVALMDIEYYAMRLMVEAKQFAVYPPVLDSVELNPADEDLPSAEKIRHAQSIVHDEQYYEKKDLIRNDMEKCLTALEAETHQTQDETEGKMRRQLIKILVLFAIQSVMVIFVLWMTSYLGISPILKGVEKIKEDSTIPVMGSYEFRYLARTYNTMYAAVKKSLASLNYEASHDKLTGLYNRAGYDFLISGLDLPTTAVLIIDADHFKEINDTVGHDAGDLVLIKIADTLRRTFRSEDYICRLGGDEFIVFMLHMDEKMCGLIERKVAQINEVLADTSDGVQMISVSVGVAFGNHASDAQTLVKQADQALYDMKENGRAGCAFYA